MTTPGTGTRRIAVNALARVEGEGALLVELHDGALHDLQLRIYEPPRFFEAFLRGRHYTEVPDLVARICGICPVAYQMSACAAIEAALGISVEGPLRELRRLLYCGEWIASHALHIYMLHAPDFLGFDTALAMGAADRERLEAGLSLKQAGNAILERIGGRAIHPVNVRVGGFHRVPTRADLAPLAEQLHAALAVAQDTVRWVAGFTFPEFGCAVPLAALRRDGEYAVLDGQWCSTNGFAVEPRSFREHVTETQVPHSTALHARLPDGSAYLVGPLARIALNRRMLGPEADACAVEAGLEATERNPFRSIIARAVEVVHACAEAIRIIRDYVPPDHAAVPVSPRVGVGYGWTEAPRGTLWHRYEVDNDGLIVSADIVPPTSQNQAAIEQDLRLFVDRNLHLDDRALGVACERVIRNHDPCISCATHFLALTVVRA